MGICYINISIRCPVHGLPPGDLPPQNCMFQPCQSISLEVKTAEPVDGCYNATIDPDQHRSFTLASFMYRLHIINRGGSRKCERRGSLENVDAGSHSQAVQ